MFRKNLKILFGIIILFFLENDLKKEEVWIKPIYCGTMNLQC